jgi:hypothetical protein
MSVTTVSSSMITDATILNADIGASAAIATTKLGAGAVVQVVNVHAGGIATGTTVIPHDTSIPQISEGTEFMTLAVTPTNASNKLIIRVGAFHTSSVVSRWILGALFQDSTANALSSAMPYYHASSPATIGSDLTMHHYMTAGTTSEITFRYRAGLSVAGTISFNGQSSAVRFGGTLSSSMTIWEISA